VALAAPVVNGLAAEQESEAAAVVEAARVAVEQEAARVAAEQEAARVAAEQAASKPTAEQSQRRPSGSAGGSASRPTPAAAPDWVAPSPPKIFVHLTNKNCFMVGDEYVLSFTVVFPDGSAYRQMLMQSTYPQQTTVLVYLNHGDLVWYEGQRLFFAYPEDQSFLPCTDPPPDNPAPGN
jgi:hypothetical protein